MNNDVLYTLQSCIFISSIHLHPIAVDEYDGIRPLVTTLRYVYKSNRRTFGDLCSRTLNYRHATNLHMNGDH